MEQNKKILNNHKKIKINRYIFNRNSNDSPNLQSLCEFCSGKRKQYNAYCKNWSFIQIHKKIPSFRLKWLFAFFCSYGDIWRCIGSLTFSFSCRRGNVTHNKRRRTLISHNRQLKQLLARVASDLHHCCINPLDCFFSNNLSLLQLDFRFFPYSLSFLKILFRHLYLPFNFLSRFLCLPCLLVCSLLC